GDEVEDVKVLIEGAFDLDGDSVVVAVEPFALVPGIGNEMATAKGEVVLGDADAEAFGHGQFSRARCYKYADCQGCCRGSAIVPLRRAMNKLAVTRSATAPGLRRLPSARSHSSKSRNWATLAGSSGQPAASTSAARRPASSATAIPSLRAIKLSPSVASN